MSKFDTNSLTLGEVDIIETLSGQPIGAMADENRPKGKSLAALAYVVKRRSDPTFTFAQAQSLSMGDLKGLGLSDDETPATGPFEGAADLGTGGPSMTLPEASSPASEPETSLSSSSGSD
jgi:hypothetical protein